MMVGRTTDYCWPFDIVTFCYVMTSTLLLQEDNDTDKYNHQPNKEFSKIWGGNIVDCKYIFKSFLFNVFTFLNNWVLQIHFILAPSGLKDGKCDTKELQISILIQDKMIVFILKNSTRLSPEKRDQQQTHTHKVICYQTLSRILTNSTFCFYK